MASKLGDYITDIAAGPFGSNLKVECFVPVGFPIIDGANLKEFKVTDNVTKFVTEEKARSLHRSIAKRGDLVVTISGNVGQISYIPEDSQYEEYLVSQRQFRATLDTEKVDVQYLVYYFHTREGQHKILSFANQTGVPALAQPLKNFKNIELELPSLPEQKRIAAILSSLDDKIENNRRINRNLEEQAQALFKSWFVDFEPFKDGEFVDSELGMIPKGWRVEKLENVTSFISRGVSPKYNEDSADWVLGQTCVRNNIVTLTNARKHLPKNTAKNVRLWDTLINSTGFGSLGRVGRVYFDMPNVAFDSHLTVVRTENPLLVHYIGRNLLSRQAEIENMAIGSTGQTELPRDSVKQMNILIPSDDILEMFNRAIEPMAKQMYATIEENIHLAQLRDTLLPKLMNGEIEL